MKLFVIIPVLWAVFMGIIVNVYAIESQTKNAKQKFAASIKAKPFPLSQVTLLESPFKDAMRWDYSKNAQGCLECHTF